MLPVLAATTLLLAIAPLLQAQAESIGTAYAPVEITQHGYALQLDNDLFAGAGDGRDRDYSWGATVTVGSPGTGRLLGPLHRARSGIASLLPGRETPAVSRAFQFGIIAMTPEDLEARKAQPGDRPYANLVYLTVSELSIGESGDRARFSSLSVGVIGSGVAESLQRSLHRARGGVVPRGWNHEISDGGEPTARYLQAEQWLVGDVESAAGASRQAKLTVAGSAGYLTEASAAVSLRWGRIETPWWSFNPELGDYTPAPIAPVNSTIFADTVETYGFVGARVKFRAYSTLLQGQFRDSDVRVASDDLARTQAEVWAGITSVIAAWRVTYSVHFASREITASPADRSMLWASLSFERAF